MITRLDQFHNINIEMETLGSMLNDQWCLHHGMMTLDEECFWNEKEKLIFNAMKKDWSETGVTTIATISKALGKDLEKVGISYLSNIFEHGFNRTAFNSLTNALIEYKKAYKTFKLSDTIQEMFNKEVDYKDIIGAISQSLDTINANSDVENGDALAIYQDALKGIKERCESGNYITGISTGYKKLDEKINGLKKSEMIVIAGRPAMGKTTVGVNIGINAGNNGKNVALFTLEMSKNQIMNKILSTISGVEFFKIEKGLLSASDWRLLNNADNKAKNLLNHFFIFDKTHCLSNIISQCRSLSRKKKLDLIIIDYLQLVEYRGSGNFNREQEVSRISRALKLLSSELEVPVIALSQLSRATEQRMDKRPVMSDLRESGGIENDANIILMCYRDEVYNPDTEHKGIIELICVKNRAGETGTIKLSWLPEFQAIDDIFYKTDEENPF